MPDAKRAKPAAGRPAEQAEVDPRLALAQQYLKAARAEIAEKEASQPRAYRRNASRDGDSPKPFALSIAPATFVHVLLAIFAFTFTALALLWCVHLMFFNLVVGRVVALPTGVVVFATLSYLSVLYLGIIESTSTGHTDISSLQGDWQEWFWTLPSTLGMLAIAAFIGWFLSLGMPVNVWLLIALSALVFYPILQLSSLETGSPLSPLSLPVLQSIVRRPLAWFVFYAISFAIANLLWAVARLAWREPPYLTLLVLGPLITLALFFYAWLLGQLALLISSQKE